MKAIVAFKTARSTQILCVVGLVYAAILLTSACATADEPPIPGMEAVTIIEKLDGDVPLDLKFTDHRGQTVKLADFFSDDTPVMLTLNYYRCPMLCNLQLNQLTESLRQLEWKPGENFRIVTVSIDPREGPELAAEKRQSHLDKLGKGEVEWEFLVGEQDAITALAQSVGFGYKYVEERDEYAHTAAVFFLSPEGKVARYLYGLEYPPRDLKFAAIEAAAGRVGSPVDKLLLSCFVYDHTEGAYGPFAFGIMRLGGGLTVLILGAFLAVLWIRERAMGRRRAKDAETHHPIEGSGVGSSHAA